MSIVLQLENVCLRYEQSLAVDALNLHVCAGEVYGLLGPNGSGKSTTLAAVAGLLPLGSGTIRLAGLTHAREAFAYRARLGYVPQELALYDELTVLDNLRFFGQMYGVRSSRLAARVEFVLEFIHLTEHARNRVRTLSGGMQRRLNLGCALLHEPRLLLLDEPTVGVDIATREALFDNLRELRGQGCALVFTTHHLEEAEQLCDRIGLMYRGKLVAEGTLDELDAALEDQRPLPTRRPRLERLFMEWTARGQTKS